MAELKEFKLPDAGEGLTEADIVAWHVKPGDQVEDGQIIVEVETAKAVVELPSPWDGTVVRLLAEEGQTVEVGAPIIAIEVAGAAGVQPIVAAPVQEKADHPERSEVPAVPPLTSPNGMPSWSATASRPPPPPAVRARRPPGWPPRPRGPRWPRSPPGRRYRRNRR